MPYIQYLLPGTIVLAIFVSAMIGGGIIFIDDKARGLHEGYLVTPIRKFELILGFTLSGAIKAIIAGIVLVTARLAHRGHSRPVQSAAAGADAVAGGADVAGADQHDVPAHGARERSAGAARDFRRAEHGAVSSPAARCIPPASFPAWMKAIAVVDPFTYAVHGFKELVLKNTGLMAISGDLAFLLGFTMLAMGAATLLFRRTL